MNANRSKKRHLRKNQLYDIRQETLSYGVKSHQSGLETIGYVAQIALAVVAIFGYFYTVQPTYQKERLAEQVADYEGIIKKQTPKIAEIEGKLVDLERERVQLSEDIQRERARLANELLQVERQLTAARAEKDRVESQIQYMTYRYRLPDGTPAVTGEQVKVAQVHELKRSYFSTLMWSCSQILSGPFARYTYIKSDERSKAWPFTDKEINAWKEHGNRYPLTAVLECIDSASSKFTERYGKGNSFAEIEGWRKHTAQYAKDKAAEKTWVPSSQPTEVMQQLASMRAASEATLKTDLNRIEEEQGDWESTIGEARRAIAKHNYGVSKLNARNQELSRRYSMESEAEERANELRNSINEEIKRLFLIDSKGGAKSPK